MKKFIGTLFVFSIILMSIIFAANRNYYPSKGLDTSGYMAAIIDKHAYAEKIRSPRIILCGGSNLAFGINSKKLSEATGLPVVNLGLYGGLGLDFMLNEAKYIVKPLDIVIICPEYYLDLDGEYQAKKETARIYPVAKFFFKQSVREFLTDFFIEDLQKNLTNLFSPVSKRQILSSDIYSRSSFNQQGDVIRNFQENPSHQFMKEINLDYSYYQGIKVMNDFKDFTDKHRISVYYIYPCFPFSVYNSNAGVIKMYQRDLSNGLHIRVLNTAENSVFPDSLFYDTEYHLIPEGREERTKRIIISFRNHHIGRSAVRTPTISKKIFTKSETPLYESNP